MTQTERSAHDWDAAVADRCRGRGLVAAGNLRRSLVKRDLEVKWHVSTGSTVASYLIAIHAQSAMEMGSCESV